MGSRICAAIETATTPRARRSAVDDWLDQLDAGERDAIIAACTPGRVTTVYRALRDEGVQLPFAESTWFRHWQARNTTAGVAA